MDEYTLIQDLGIVLLAAGVAGTLCRRLGLSVVVGYLLAGIIIGPHTPPFSFVTNVGRIQTLSQIGLVFLMFAIGLGLSLSKLGRMGWSTLIATGLGALLMLNMTKLLGFAIGWTTSQSLFIAAMFMVSSSAVIAKVVGELNLTHDRPAQLALGITVLEDVVAVVMLTILAAQSGGGSANIGKLLGGMTVFIVLLVGVGLLMVPRLMRRLEARADPELQTIVVAGLLFLLSIAAVKAGYSLALGAFLLGAIVAEIPQKGAVEKSFNGMRDLFSSVFFVSIGMMIDPGLLLDVWPMVIGLGVFALVVRSFATGLALVLCGTRPREARRAGLLLSPLGEFSFIIAQLGVSLAVLPENYYPLAVGVSIFTVLIMPWVNRHAEWVLNLLERIEPAWLSRGVEAYHSWLEQVQETTPSSAAWSLIRGRLVQIAVEMLFVTGVMTFARPLLDLLLRNRDWLRIEPQTLTYVFWSAITVLALIPLVAIWRSLVTIAMILAETFGGVARIPAGLVQNGVKAAGAVLLGYWLFAILPTDQLGLWGWGLIALAAALVVAVFSSRLIYWQSHWQSSVNEVLAEDPRVASAAVAAAARGKRARDLEEWNVRLIDCVVPEAADYAGRTLAEVSIPSRFGCAVLEIERNGHVITAVRPDVRLYPGDKLLLLGPAEQLKAACAFLANAAEGHDESDEFRGSVLETFEIPPGPRTGKTLAELNLGKVTGTRVVGIQRSAEKIIAPSGEERLSEGDSVLVAGTLAEIGAFRRWLYSETTPPFAAGVSNQSRVRPGA
jgi:monovalent cation:H+ antiporter-2, CPA2 family